MNTARFDMRQSIIHVAQTRRSIKCCGKRRGEHGIFEDFCTEGLFQFMGCPKSILSYRFNKLDAFLFFISNSTVSAHIWRWKQHESEGENSFKSFGINFHQRQGVWERPDQWGFWITTTKSAQKEICMWITCHVGFLSKNKLQLVLAEWCSSPNLL